MAQRFRWLVIAGLALVPTSGCMPSYLDWSTNKATAPVEDRPHAGRNELPNDQTAQIFLETGHQMEKARDLPAAVRCYERAIVLDPTCEDGVAHKLAVLYDKTGDATKALAEYQRALKNKPKDTNLLNDVGQHYALVANWTEAETYYRRSLEQESRNTRARMNLALALAQERRDPEAVEEWRKVTGHAEALFNDGFVQLSQGRREEARATFRQVLNIDPSFRRAQAALAKLDQPAPAPPAPPQTSAPAPKPTALP